MEAAGENTSLIAEVQRYLAVVEIFRAEGCHPHWSAELVPAPVRGRLAHVATLRPSAKGGRA
jgi:hypothetical protein